MKLKLEPNDQLQTTLTRLDKTIGKIAVILSMMVILAGAFLLGMIANAH